MKMSIAVVCVGLGMVLGAVVGSLGKASANNDAWNAQDVGRLIRAVEAMKCH